MYFSVAGSFSVLLLGANWNNSSNCSSRSVNCNNGSSNVNSNYSARSTSDTWGKIRGASYPMAEHIYLAVLQNTRRGKAVVSSQKRKSLFSIF